MLLSISDRSINMTQEYLKSILEWDNDSLKFRRKISRGRFKAGTELTFSKDKQGRCQTKIDGVAWKRAHLVWLYYTGENMKVINADEFNTKNTMVIDHINQNPNDDRIENLRKITKAENCRNRTLAKNNKYGAQGVHYRKSSDRWIAEIRYNYYNIYLGSYVTKDEAVAARQGAEKALGFHDNHGSDNHGR